MTKDELKDRISMALKDPILQQGFEIICKENAELEERIRNQAESLGVTLLEEDKKAKRIKELEKENAELKEIAEFQQSSNMSRHFENKKLKECLVVGSTWNKALNSMNRFLEEERDKYRNMVFDKDEQLTKAKEIIKNLLDVAKFYNKHRDKGAIMDITPIYDAEQFLKEAEK